MIQHSTDLHESGHLHCKGGHGGYYFAQQRSFKFFVTCYYRYMFLFPFFSSLKEDYYRALLKSCELNAEVSIWGSLDFPRQV
jgi:hypothetical protein